MGISWGMLNDGGKVRNYRKDGVNRTAPTITDSGFDLGKVLRLTRNYFAKFRTSKTLYGKNSTQSKEEKHALEDQIDSVIRARFNAYRCGETDIISRLPTTSAHA